MESPAHVVGRAAGLLRALAAGEPDGLSTTRAGQEGDLPRPTAHRLLGDLAAEGLVERGDDGRWRLGPELWLLGRAAARRYDVVGLARPALARLTEATGESAFLSARRGEETVCLAQQDGSFPIRSHVLHEGIRFPLGVASAGLVILAHLPAPQRTAYLDAVDLAADFGVAHDRPGLERRVRATRRTGYAVNPGLLVEGSWGMGAAVFDADGAPAWALSLTGVASRFGPARRASYGEMLLREAHDLTQRLQR
ncbi:IclR family transcriptional regulator [uncultured Nocardioides sp.]|uniref:IclR family transcriptional regulator n=1 Tax=uncultured Nocardioides sp. TaxID=198441 RepID=UPI0026365675|nr:IclR family transcriptional regulator [uncultured Nocardioides sp.]